jgi:hypothetical protein
VALLWRAWQAYAKRAGQYQTRVLLAVVYVVVVGPMAMAARLAGNRLLDDGQRGTGGWLRRPAQDSSLHGMRRQF